MIPLSWGELARSDDWIQIAWKEPAQGLVGT